MPKSGSVGGVAPASPASTSASPQDGGAKAAAPRPEAKADGKSSAPPLPDASGRAPPEMAPRTAVALAATLAGLTAGQELHGTVRLLPGRSQALLTTPEGEFLLSPATGLAPDGEVSLVLTRADRSIAALLLTQKAGGDAGARATLDPPRPVQLTLVAIRGGPAPATPSPLPAPSPPSPVQPPAVQHPAVQHPAGQHPAGQPSPSQPSPAQAPPTQAPPTQAPPTWPTSPLPGNTALHSLLPGETVALRGGARTPPNPALHTAAPQPPQGPPQGAPRPMLHGLMLPEAAPAASAPQSGSAAPLAALFDRGVLPLALHTGTGPVKMLSASLLATAAPGETSPLTDPPASSPLARLAETGRLVTATALPPSATAEARIAPRDSAQQASPQPRSQSQSPSQPQPQPQSQPQVPAQPDRGTAAKATPAALASAAPREAEAPAPMNPGLPPAARSTPQAPVAPLTPAASTPAPAPAPAAPQPGQPVRLDINGTAARLELPAGTPAPAPGTRLVFLVTKGHEALQALPAAPAGSATPPPAAASPVGAEPVPVQPVPVQPVPVQPVPPPRMQPAPERGAVPQAPRAATTAPASIAIPVMDDGNGRTVARPAQSDARQMPAAPAPETASVRPSSPQPVPAQASPLQTPSAQTSPAQAPSSPPAPASPLVPPPEMQAVPWMPGMPLPNGVTPAAPVVLSGGEALLMAVMQALGRKGFTAAPRVAASASGEDDSTAPAAGAQALARLLREASGTALARAEAAQDAPAATTEVPDALPFALTLQTPQGPVPLVFLVWQPVRREEDGGNDGASGEGEPDVCFAVEVEFESVGRLRLRGAVGSGAAGQRSLHLGVESERPLGDALQHAASRDFTNAIESGGMTGTLVFRHRQSA